MRVTGSAERRWPETGVQSRQARYGSLCCAYCAVSTVLGGSSGRVRAMPPLFTTRECLFTPNIQSACASYAHDQQGLQITLRNIHAVDSAQVSDACSAQPMAAPNTPHIHACVCVCEVGPRHRQDTRAHLVLAEHWLLSVPHPFLHRCFVIVLAAGSCCYLPSSPPASAA